MKSLKTGRSFLKPTHLSVYLSLFLSWVSGTGNNLQQIITKTYLRNKHALAEFPKHRLSILKAPKTLVNLLKIYSRRQITSIRYWWDGARRKRRTEAQGWKKKGEDSINSCWKSELWSGKGGKRGAGRETALKNHLLSSHCYRVLKGSKAWKGAAMVAHTDVFPKPAIAYLQKGNFH